MHALRPWCVVTTIKTLTIYASSRAGAILVTSELLPDARIVSCFLLPEWS